jgi:methylglutaconyl-CoA hydratase
MDMLKTLEVAYGPGTAVVWLNRADKQNAIDELMARELIEVFEGLGEDPEVNAIVLASKADAFCSGVDLSWMHRVSLADEQQQQAALALIETLMLRVHQSVKPVIARINGACVGLGVTLVACADLGFAGRTSTFSYSETRMGLIPSLSAPYLIKAIGERAAMRWLLTGETFTASEAWRLGLLHDVSEDYDLDGNVNALLGALTLTQASCVQETKKTIQQLSVATSGAENASLLSISLKAQRSEAGREGMAAFLDKRLPVWAPPRDLGA